MTGLRERQKKMRRQAISRAGVKLFERKGFQSTTIEQIAQEAGVSAPTVFKYFGSKHEILVEMLQEGDQRAISEARAHIAEMDDPLDALCYLEKVLVDQALAMLPAPIWRELLLHVLSGGLNGLPGSYKRMNDVLRGEIAGLLRELQNAGKLRADLDVDLAAFLLNDYSHLQLLRLTSSEPLDLETHRQQVRQTSGLILYGMAAHGPAKAD
ncbi:transcriptional regulator, TetR family [Pseudomonas cuatrocienegasensis]|uniref:Transcriptional regulator, TetR family n=1 Tax=Pseudomonas cuatrocienegasensis TaxID=543360 RepID=A0ABY1B4N2_9PSED|nr:MULTISPECIES: TetR/AcrR family transcriptional regulator [Pseudomonas]OEC37251.1 TetR family transcriptional regulator [Pseudomonas sp. 21C1]SEP90507.1 transcriptional regulator, TetR family [Pseudomonas cuatrocienegasensis]